jgi:hypothetical protein
VAILKESWSFRVAYCLRAGFTRSCPMCYRRSVCHATRIPLYSVSVRGLGASVYRTKHERVQHTPNVSAVEEQV